MYRYRCRYLCIWSGPPGAPTRPARDMSGSIPIPIPIPIFSSPAGVAAAVGYSSKGGAVGGGVQWMGVVLSSKIAYDIM